MPTPSHRLGQPRPQPPPPPPAREQPATTTTTAAATTTTIQLRSRSDLSSRAHVVAGVGGSIVCGECGGGSDLQTEYILDGESRA